jgi:hypothetical protein
VTAERAQAEWGRGKGKERRRKTRRKRKGWSQPEEAPFRGIQECLQAKQGKTTKRSETIR